MNRARTSLLIPTAVALLLGVYALAVHYANEHASLRALGAALAVLPVIALAADLARRARPRWLAALALICLATLTMFGWRTLEAHFDWLLLAQQALAYLVLAAAFGASLLPGREPLCTQLARMLQGPLDDATRLYTRQVTLAWAALLLMIAATMAVLYAAGSMRAWSLFANFGPLVLLPAMFCIELQVRRRRLPHAPRLGPLQMLAAWRRHRQIVGSR